MADLGGHCLVAPFERVGIKRECFLKDADCDWWRMNGA
jgi:hypothetical protein